MLSKHFRNSRFACVLVSVPTVQVRIVEFELYIGGVTSLLWFSFCGPELVSIIVLFPPSEYLPGGKTLWFSGFVPFRGIFALLGDAHVRVFPFSFLLASWPRQ